MTTIVMIVIAIVCTCICGCIIAYHVFQMVDFVIGILIVACVVIFILYQFLSPTSMLHQAMPELPTRYRLP